jgi:hypothetical protein
MTCATRNVMKVTPTRTGMLRTILLRTRNTKLDVLLMELDMPAREEDSHTSYIKPGKKPRARNEDTINESS